MTQLVALPDGTELAGEYKIERVLGAGGFGVTYLATEPALSRSVSIKEYFPSDFATRGEGLEAVPRSKGSVDDYNWGLERFVEEAQTLARFDHTNIVRVYRIFRANNTAYMVLQFEEGQNLKSWLKGLGRAPRQKELDGIVAPLLDALEVVHKSDVLHRDIAPDNIIIRKSGDPVLIDFGAARGDIAAHSKTKTVSALVKPGYSPYEQYAETSRQQGPWTDIYALSATLYHAISGKRPPDSPSRMLKDELKGAREAAVGSYRDGFLSAIDSGLKLAVDARPQTVAAWRGALLAPAEKQAPALLGAINRIKERTEVRRKADRAKREAEAVANAPVPPPPDVPGPKGGLLDFVDALQKPAEAKPQPVEAAARKTTKPKAAAAPVAKAPVEAKAAAQLPVPIAQARGKRKTRPNPDVARSRALMRGLKTKLAIAVTIAAALVAFQDQLPKLLLVPGTAITTGTLAVAGAERHINERDSFKAHDAAVTGIALSGDGRLVVTASADGTLKVWSAQSHAPIGTINLPGGPATSLAVRNNRAVTSHRDGTTSVYDLDTRNRLYTFKRNEAAVWAAVFAGTEDAVAAGSHDWSVTLWQSGSETTPLTVFEGHQSAVQALAADTSGRWIASGGADKTVRLWDLERRDLRRGYRNFNDYVSALSFSSDGATLAAGSLDGSVKLWSVPSGRGMRTFGGGSSRVTSIAFSPDDSLLAIASDDGAVRLRSLKRSRNQWALSGGPGATTVTFTNDGRTLVTGGRDGMVRLWSMPEAEIAQRN